MEHRRVEATVGEVRIKELNSSYAFKRALILVDFRLERECMYKNKTARKIKKNYTNPLFLSDHHAREKEDGEEEEEERNEQTPEDDDDDFAMSILFVQPSQTRRFFFLLFV